MKTHFYKTKLTIEVEVETRFGPQDAINLISSNLNMTAVKGIQLEKIESDYVCASEFDSNSKSLKNVPCKLK